MRKIRIISAFAALTLLITANASLCLADTVAVPYGSTNVITQGIPQGSGSYSRTDIVYAPGASGTYDPYAALYQNGINGAGGFNVNNTQYSQITTTYGNTGMATVTVTPYSPTGVPSDTDAYNMAYLSALQSYGLTIDPVTGGIAQVTP